MITLHINLFEGNYPLTQLFGENPQVYSKFGMLGHNGIDYGLPVGTPLYSCIDGTVIESQNDPTGYGEYIKIENDSCGVIYGHRKEKMLNAGDKVVVGQLIGYSGNTGNSTGPHLHFGVFPKPRNRGNGYAGYIDPLDTKQVTWIKNTPKDYQSLYMSASKELVALRATNTTLTNVLKQIKELVKNY